MLIQRVQKNFKIYVAFCQQDFLTTIFPVKETYYIHTSQELHIGIPSFCPTAGQM